MCVCVCVCHVFCFWIICSIKHNLSVENKVQKTFKAQGINYNKRKTVIGSTEIDIKLPEQRYKLENS